MSENDNFDVTLACPKCEMEQQLWVPHVLNVDKFCPRCGRALVPKPSPPAPKTIPMQNLPIPELTALILKTINTISETGKKEAKEREEARARLLDEEHSYVRHTVSIDGINLVSTVHDEQAEVIVYEDSPKGGETILNYIVDLEALPELWDDLTDILTLGVHPTIFRKYFKRFSVKDKKYKKHITIIYEGGELYA